mmetsp:Transcript_48203/g.122357  ORF Transcript_48203/g.122357 Transcript_48203/m.122357 type:complete len:226 (+) Transcript_48203:108-785(+)
MLSFFANCVLEASDAKTSCNTQGVGLASATDTPGASSVMVLPDLPPLPPPPSAPPSELAEEEEEEEDVVDEGFGRLTTSNPASGTSIIRSAMPASIHWSTSGLPVLSLFKVERSPASAWVSFFSRSATSSELRSFSTRTTSGLPSSMAKSKAVNPSASRSMVLALAFKSTIMDSSCENNTATITGVAPPRRCTFTSARCFTSALHTSSSPRRAAKWRADEPTVCS